MELETAPWPAAKQGGTLLVAHPAWEDARNAILDLAAEGPVTVALVGPSGTGKTWLLRELAGCLGDHGFPTMILLQGDLPSFLADGAALLIDQAIGMPGQALDQLLGQHHGVAILADVERFADIVQARSSEPVIVPLRLLGDTEMLSFIAEWLRQSGQTAKLDPATISHLRQEARGLVGRAVPLLTAAIAQRRAVVEPATRATPIDRAPMERPKAEPIRPAPEPLPPVPVSPVLPSRTSSRPAILATMALAACIALAWFVGPALFGPAPTTEPVAARSLPQLSPAEISAPIVAQQAPPSPAQASAADHLEAAAPPITPIAAPRIAQADTPPAIDRAPLAAVTSSPSRLASRAPADQAAVIKIPIAPAPTPRPALPSPAQAVSPVTVAAPPVMVAAGVDTVAIPIAVAPNPSAQSGGIGMALLAQRGDTLKSMYRDIYRGRVAPPYTEVAAANRHQLKPGTIVLFPAPPGGWGSHASGGTPAAQR